MTATMNWVSIPSRLRFAPLLCACLFGCASDRDRADLRGDTSAAVTGAMAQVSGFGTNPGALLMYEYVPAGLPASAPLVVVLHGCTQGAADMVAAGWNELADEYGFAVVYAEQATANNPLRCFNWAGEYGDPANMTRGQGENQSIKEMVDYMIANRGVDGSRVYVSGFSAGGGMASVMMATWPDVFRAGAIQSGIAYRCANTVQTAYDCQQMNLNPDRKRSATEWGDLVRQAHPGYTGPYPRVSIWHGLADTFVVHHENRLELLKQWTDVHGLDQTPSATDEVGGHQRERFVKNNVAVVESYAIDSMGHAVAFGLDDAAHPCGPPGFAQYYEDRGICASYHIADFFGLITGVDPGPSQCPGQPGCDGEPIGDREAPRVSISAPGDGQTVAGTVTVSVTASDDVGIERVELYIDGALLATDRSAPYSFDWPTAAYGEGAHSLMAMAYDAAGNVAVDDATTVIVDNDGDPGPGATEPPGFAGCSSGGGGAATGFWLIGVLALLTMTVGQRRRRRWASR